MQAIKVENLTKKFNGVIAVDHISFSLIMIFLGAYFFEKSESV
jgi:ABC-type multidrug transport system ATPase subunit